MLIDHEDRSFCIRVVVLAPVHDLALSLNRVARFLGKRINGMGSNSPLLIKMSSIAISLAVSARHANRSADVTIIGRKIRPMGRRLDRLVKEADDFFAEKLFDLCVMFLQPRDCAESSRKEKNGRRLRDTAVTLID